MALYIRDPEVDRLVEELQNARKNVTKTEIVRAALQKQVEAERAELPLIEKVRALQVRAGAMGFRHGPDIDMKAFMDEQWGDD